MERTSTASTKFVLAMFAALMAFNIYRAATRDVTPSEAWNYDRFVGLPWANSLDHFDANNHVLNTLLERISTKRFHLTELSLRLPALLGGILYLWAVFRICRRWFGRGLPFSAAVVVMALNPLVVDALSEARGYGFAMAFWLLALDLLLQYQEGLESRKLNLAALCLSLSVAGSLSFIIPVLGLLAVFAWLVRRPMSRDLYLPLIVFLFVLLAIPMNRVLLSDLAAGSKSWPVAVWALGAVLAGFVASAVRKRDSTVLLPAGTALIALLILQATHKLISAPFPDRGAIYFVPILTLTGLSVVRRYPRILVAAAFACVLIYAAWFPIGPYRDGREFAGSRDIAKMLRADAGQRPVRVAASLDLEPVINYYRSRYRQANWERIPRKPLAPGYEYYVLTTADAARVDGLRLRVLHRTPGIILARSR
jgi:hypothetical protein